ncbi:MAG: hypothetical protein ACRDJW_19495 [Thermomicrobiales bacterium]
MGGRTLMSHVHRIIVALDYHLAVIVVKLDNQSIEPRVMHAGLGILRPEDLGVGAWTTV